jgi:hypothetical protein
MASVVAVEGYDRLLPRLDNDLLGLVNPVVVHGVARTATSFTVQASQDFQLNAAPGPVSAVLTWPTAQLLLLAEEGVR